MVLMRMGREGERRSSDPTSVKEKEREENHQRERRECNRSMSTCREDDDEAEQEA